MNKQRSCEKEQNNQSVPQSDENETVETAVIAISMVMAFLSCLNQCATHMISGGQTMNPSTEDIVKMIEQSQCKRAIILPNNKNILMASEQAADIVEAEAIVIPTKSILKALLHYLTMMRLIHLMIINLVWWNH